MKKINNIFNTANKSLFAIGDTSRRSTPDSSGQRRILLSSCRGPISPLARGVPARAGCRKFGVRFAALVALFVATPSFAEPTELDKKTVASKAYVDTKQDKIPAGTYGANASVVTYDSTSGDVQERWVLGGGLIGDPDFVLSQAYIILASMDDYTGHFTANNYGEILTDPANFTFTSITRDEAEKSLVTSAVLGYALNRKQSILPAAWRGTTGSGLASTGGQTIDLTATAGEVGRRYITAGGAQPLTQKAGADNVILYINGTKTLAQYQTSNFGATDSSTATRNENYIKGALVSLELLKDVYSALHNEIQNATPTGTPGNVAMYDPSTGALGDGVATYSGATAQNPYNATNDAAKIATAAAVETKQTKRVCAGYEPGHENDPDYCWLWDFPD
ncbi:MAG: hypothetical protein IJL21_03900 [Alphaproteobacteria bacterium]|nr:hypothetical protein [Alphaproteobacteria bacterium]